MNEDCPEDNREVYVFQVKDIPGVINTKERFYGFYIALGMDPRWYEDDDQVEAILEEAAKEQADIDEDRDDNTFDDDEEEVEEKKVEQEDIKGKV